MYIYVGTQKYKYICSISHCLAQTEFNVHTILSMLCLFGEYSLGKKKSTNKKLKSWSVVRGALTHKKKQGMDRTSSYKAQKME